MLQIIAIILLLRKLCAPACMHECMCVDARRKDRGLKISTSSWPDPTSLGLCFIIFVRLQVTINIVVIYNSLMDWTLEL